MSNTAKFETPVSSPHVEEAIKMFTQGNAKALIDWISGSDTTGRAAAVAVLASTLFGSDAAVAARLGRGVSTISGWRYGNRTPGDSLYGGIGKGNREALCNLVIAERRRLYISSAKPTNVLTYNPLQSFKENDWINHPVHGLGLVCRKLSRKMQVVFQDMSDRVLICN